jgi:hypothetical protein
VWPCPDRYVVGMRHHGHHCVAVNELRLQVARFQFQMSSSVSPSASVSLFEGSHPVVLFI